MSDDSATAVKSQPERQEASGPHGGGADRKKPYKSPTMKRHGNLRLMTQLE